MSALQWPKKSGKAARRPLDALISPEEYNDLVDIYPGFNKNPRSPTKDPPSPPEDPPDLPNRQQHYPLASSLVLTPSQEQNSRPGKRLIRDPESPKHARKLSDFIRLVQKNKLGYVPLSDLWSAYEALPAPRPPYLTNHIIYRAFRHLAWVEHHDAEDGAAMRRFFALLNECVSENVRLNDMVWNTAISFSGRWMRRVTGDRVKAAVQTWMQMEGAGQQATNVTFNIIFDLAVRSGRYALADTIFEELKARKMPLNRYFRTSVIFYAGMKRDGDGVRKAFRELVNAGEIVDTAVMNCVIVSLLRAGEAPAAETVFARMIRLHEEKFGTAPPTDWREMKELGGLLNETGEKLRREESRHEASFFGGKFSMGKKREELQKAAPIAPNANTYRIMIKYHAHTSGDLPRIHTLLAEMKEKDFNVHGSVYVHILRGFAAHGGFAFSAWSRMSLENLWAEVAGVVGLKAVEAQVTEHESDDVTILEEVSGIDFLEDGFSDASQESPVSEQGSPPENSYRPLGPQAEDASGNLEVASQSSQVKSYRYSPTSSDVSTKPMHITDYDFSHTNSIAQSPRSQELSAVNPSSLPFTETSPPPETTPPPEAPLPFSPEDSEEEDPHIDPPTSELDRPTYMTPSLALAAINAFYKVTGYKRMLHVWAEIQASWEGATQEQRERVQRVVDEHVAENEKYVEWERSGWRRSGTASVKGRGRSGMYGD
ncbi:unnamed protein product [Zymoseptoria tritici ST99CH_3D7]|uniref:Pentacotripeptide-repeat region of PRORP domain-containing protein n=1 Tax=Zymoseptoria tritici (strain ST99CH_3D7) TaxID=1276538 RepID=A0A1X7S970_ZYMT9|nr:unnamed protein product [Zymoseptoria tritici ST99CH_3D7]